MALVTKDINIALETSVQEVKELIQNQEAVSQEILEKVNATNITLFPSDDVKITKELTKSKAMKEDTASNYKVMSLIPKNSGVIRIKYKLSGKITANSYSGSSISSFYLRLATTKDVFLYDVVDGTLVSTYTQDSSLAGGNSGIFGIGKAANYPVGTSGEVSGFNDIEVTQGVPVIVMAAYNGNDTFNGITCEGKVELEIAYKEVAW